MIMRVFRTLRGVAQYVETRIFLSRHTWSDTLDDWVPISKSERDQQRRAIVDTLVTAIILLNGVAFVAIVIHRW